MNKNKLIIYIVAAVLILIIVNIYRGYHSSKPNKSAHPTDTSNSGIPKSTQAHKSTIDPKDEALIKHYTEELTKDTDRAMNYYQRALVYQKIKQYNLAILDYNNAIKLTPESSNAYFNRGLTYYQAMQLDAALDDFTQALTINPKDMHIYNARGLVYSDQGEFDKALDDFNQALILDPSYASAMFNRATIYERKQKYQDALADYDNAIKNNKAELENEDPEAIKARLIEAYYRRGIINLALNDLNAAMRDVNFVIENNPNLAKAFKLRATIYGKQGNTGAASSDEATAENLNIEGLMR